MMKPTEHPNLLEMLLAAHHIEDTVVALDEDAFRNMSHPNRLMIIRLLILIGAAIDQLPLEYRMSHPQIPWARFLEMKEMLEEPHGTVDPSELYDFCFHEIFILIGALEAITKSVPHVELG